jgi:hypothetical protein
LAAASYMIYLTSLMRFLNCLFFLVGVALLSGSPEEDAKTRKQKKATNVCSFRIALHDPGLGIKLSLEECAPYISGVRTRVRWRAEIDIQCHFVRVVNMKLHVVPTAEISCFDFR